MKWNVVFDLLLCNSKLLGLGPILSIFQENSKFFKVLVSCFRSRTDKDIIFFKRRAYDRRIRSWLGMKREVK